LRQLGRSVALALIGAVILVGGASAAFADTRGHTSSSGPTGAALDPGLFSQLASGVVRIRGLSCAGTPKITGTGFLVGNGVVMTARHVVDPGGAEAKLACRVQVRVDGHRVGAARIGWWSRAADPTGRATDLATVKLTKPASAEDYIFDFRNASPRVGTNLSMLGHPSCPNNAFVNVNMYDASNTIVDTGIDEIPVLPPNQVALTHGDTFNLSVTTYRISGVDCFNFSQP
jgi:hypothetical protein